MLKFLKKNLPNILLAAVLLACLWLLMGRPVRTGSGGSSFRDAALSTWLPLQRLVSSVLAFPEETLNAVRELGNLREEVKRLQVDNQSLRQQLSAQKSLRDELDRLQAVLKVKGKFPQRARIARIIAHDPSTWNQSFVIDVGSQDGIQVDSPVVSEQGVVGRVLEVSEAHCRVLLLTDADSSVAGIDDRSRVNGIVQGTGSGRLRLSYVEAKEDVQKDDRILSSGLGGVFPKGYLIGTVLRRAELEKGLIVEIDVVPAVDFAALDYVFVLPPLALD
jgi:rod shape-determining protein MreC